jgi:hypothetical protein
MEASATLGAMNPIALIEATASARSAVLGALATDPVVASRTADTAARLSTSCRTVPAEHPTKDHRPAALWCNITALR